VAFQIENVVGYYFFLFYITFLLYIVELKKNNNLNTIQDANDIFIGTKFSYKISCNFSLQTYLISFYEGLILTNLPLDYIFLYSPCLQNFKKIKNQ